MSDPPAVPPAGAGTPIDAEAETRTRAALVAAVDALLAAMPAEQARAVRLCAVPHWLDAALLAELMATGQGRSQSQSQGASDGGDEIEGGGHGVGYVEALVRPLRFVSWEADGRFRLHDAVRAHVRDRLRIEDPDLYRSANAVALAHFRRALIGGRAAAAPERQPGPGAAKGTGTGASAGASAGAGVVGGGGGGGGLGLGEGLVAADAVEALYHRLVVDEPAGVAELELRFEDAVWNHRLGLAERFVRVAHELDAELSPRARAWIAFFVARLAQLLGTGDAGQGALSALAETAPEPRLAAAAQLALARAEVARQHWHAAAERLESGRADLLSAGGGPSDLARFDLAAGDLYRDLAVRSGGASGRDDEAGGPWRRLRLAPFLALRAMARRWRRAPNWWWWHAGADYPDWIVAWLLERAAARYRAAALGFGDGDGHGGAGGVGGARDGAVGSGAGAVARTGAGDRGDAAAVDGSARGRVDTAAALADTELHLGRWSAARAAYEHLLTRAEVARSPHATARAELGLAILAQRRGALDEARRRLDAAVDVFRRFGDRAGLTRATLARAEIEERSAAPDAAARAYTEAIPLLEAAGDGLAVTEVEARLAKLAAGGGLSEPVERTVAEARASVHERHYLARFSGAWLTWFRRLAIYVASPLTFVLGTLLLTVAIVMVGSVIETEARLLARGELHLISLPDHLVLLLTATLLTLAALWLYPFVYGLGGMVLVRLLGRRLGNIERDQPARVLVGDTRLAVVRGAGGDVRSLPWPTVATAGAADLFVRSRPIELVSRTVLTAADDRPLVIEGITGRYRALQDAVAARVPLRRYGMALFEPRWMAGTLAASTALVIGADRLGLVPVIDAVGTRPGAGERIDLTLTLTMPLAYVFLCFVLGLAIVSHWRLVAHTRRRRELEPEAGIVPLPLLVAAAVAWTIVGALIVFAVLSASRGLA